MYFYDDEELDEIYEELAKQAEKEKETRRCGCGILLDGNKKHCESWFCEQKIIKESWKW